METLSGVEESRRQGEIWTGNIHMDEHTKETTRNEKEIQELRGGTHLCYEVGGQRNPQKGARRKLRGCGAPRKVFQEGWSY